MMLDLILIFASAIFWANSSGPDSQIMKTSSEIQLDCSNYRLFEFDLTHSTFDDIEHPVTFTTDTTMSMLEQDSAHNRIRIWGDLGSETGELLFDRIDGVEYSGTKFNREHIVFAGAELHFFQNRLQLRGGFHHLGSYSDLLEKQTVQLTQKYGYAPEYNDIGDNGISEYYCGVWRFELPHLVTRGILEKYGNWILLPIVYDPLYVSGYRYSQVADLTFASDKISIISDFNFQKRFIDHKTPLNVNKFKFDAGWEHFAADCLTIGIKAKGNSDYSAKYFLSLHTENVINQKFMYWFESGIWSNQKPVGEVGLDWKPFSGLKMDLSVKYVYTPGEKEITYLSSEDTANIRIEPLKEKKIQTSVDVGNILTFPVHFRGWANIQKGSPEFLVSQTVYDYNIRQVQTDDIVAGVGGRLDADLSLFMISINPWVQGNVLLLGQLPESIPFESGVSLAHANGIGNLNKYTVSFIYREPYSLRVKTNGKYNTIATKSLLFCDISISIPFSSPIFIQHIKPLFLIKAGPVHLLNHSTRQSFHPLGSIMGPAISAEMDVDFY